MSSIGSQRALRLAGSMSWLPAMCLQHLAHVDMRAGSSCDVMVCVKGATSARCWRPRTTGALSRSSPKTWTLSRSSICHNILGSSSTLRAHLLHRYLNPGQLLAMDAFCNFDASATTCACTDNDHLQTAAAAWVCIARLECFQVHRGARPVRWPRGVRPMLLTAPPSTVRHGGDVATCR